MAKPNFTLPNKPAIKSGSILSYNYTDDFTFVPAPLTFNRDSAATRVNEKGLIEDVGYFGPELVQNGDFSEIGSELVTNGGFDTDSDWVKGAGWSISDGKAISDGVSSNSNFSQNNILTLNKAYKVSVNVILNSGTLNVYVTSSPTKVITSSGLYTFYGVCDRTDLDLHFKSVNFNGSIDNVSVKEVGQNWTFGTGWSIEDGKAVKTSGAGASLSQTLPIAVIGKKYKFTFDTIVTGGAANATLYGVTIPVFSTSGSQEHIIISTSTTGFNFYGNNLFEGSIDNVSVIEVLGDKPRIDYSDSLTEPSLLLEPQSTNLITYSEDFSQWQKLNSTVTGNSVISPDGSKNADLIDYNITSSNGYIRISHTASSVVSFYVKYKDIQWLMVYGSGLGAGKFIDIENSVIGGNVGSGVSAEITNSGNGWKRVVLKSSSSNITQTSIYAASSDGSYATISLSGGVYLWGAQAETLSYPTSYIPTYGSTATRLGETAINAGDVNVFNSEEGVLYAEIAFLNDTGNYKAISINDGTMSNRVAIENRPVSNQIKVFVVVGGVSVMNSTQTLTDTKSFNKMALKWKQNDFSWWVNGVKIHTDSSGNTFGNGVLNRLNLNGTSTSFSFEGKTKSVKVFNKALTDRELEILTIQ